MNNLSPILSVLKLLCLIFIFPKNIQAQDVTRLDIPQYAQLPNKNIRKIFQDSEGFIWYCTEEGLFRDDGYNICTFRSDFKSTYPLKHNTILCIAEDKEDKLWLGTARGAYILDKKDYSISPLEGYDFDAWSINEIKSTSDGHVWIASNNNLYKFNTKGQLVQTYHTAWNNKPQTVSSLYEDVSTNTLWITLQKGGLCYYEKEKDCFIAHDWPFSTYPTAMAKDLFHDFFWISTYGDGMIRFDPSQKAPDKQFIRQSPGSEDDASAPQKYITSFVQDKTSGDLWTITKQDFYRYRITRELELESCNTSDISPSEAKFLTSISMDRNKNLWISGFPPHSFILSFQNSEIQKYKIPKRIDGINISTSITRLIHEKGIYWIQNREGDIFVYLPRENKLVANRSFDRENPVFLEKVKQGEGVYCLLDRSKIYRLIYRKNEIHKTEIINFKALDLPYEQVRCLHEDHNGFLYIGTNHNLYRFSLTRKKLQAVWPESGIINNILVTEEQDVFATTESNGLLHIDSHGKKRQIKIAENCWTLTCTPDKNIWFCTSKGNIYRYDMLHKKIHLMTKQIGLNGSPVYNIENDSYGRLWILTPQTIFVFNPQNDVLNTFHSSDVHLSMINFSCMNKDMDGNFFIGGPNGFFSASATSFLNPQSEKEVLPQITAINVNEQLKPLSPKTKEIKINPSERDITLYVSTFNFLETPNTRFAFRYKNEQKHWNYLPQGANSIYLPQLSKGSNGIEIKATNSNGHWSEKIQSINIYCIPKWYETWIAHSVYILLTSLAILFAIHFYLKRQKAKSHRQMKRQMEEMKYRFFTNISHELRTPLTLILAPIESLLKKEDKQERKKQMEIIARNARNLLSLVNQLLDFRRIEMKGETLSCERFDLKELLERIYGSFKPLSEEKNINFRFTCHMDAFLFTADSNKLTKVVNNLLSNAFKFTPAEGKVILQLSDMQKNGNRHAVIQVTDTGSGIPKNELAHIFERFHQVGTDHNNTGSGIGLNIAKEYVQMHDGTIEVSSTLGQGSCFTVCIPTVTKSIGITDTKTFTSSSKQATSFTTPEDLTTKILLVEDNEDFRHYLRDELGNFFSICEAADGKEGEAKALKEEPDIIITDLMMPKMNGIELCKRIKHNINVSHIPVILLTASANVENEEQGYKEGADAYITKPFKWEILLARIRNLIERKQNMQSNFKQNAQTEAADITISPADEEFIRKAVSLVEKNLDNSEYNVEELSRDMAMTRVTLFRKMRSITSMTPTDFIRNTRLKHAAQLISEGKLSIAEIAYSVGFETPSYFSRLFKKEFGILPTQYLKK